MDKNCLETGKIWSRAGKFARGFLPGLALTTLLLLHFSAIAQSAGRVFVTGNPNDLRIAGNGYFMVHDPVAGSYYFTRQGQFQIDPIGYFVNLAGERLECADPLQPNFIYDLNVHKTVWTTAPLERYWITTNGQAWAQCADGSQAIVGQIVLESFSNPESLGAWLNGLWTWPTNGTSQMSLPGTNGLGTIVTGEFELPLPRLHLSAVDHSPADSGPGFFTATGLPTDLALFGSGYFMLRETNSNTLYATRAGAFFVDTNGYLVNFGQMRVQGYTDGSLSATGDIQILPRYDTAWQTGRMTSGFAIDRFGTVNVSLNDGEQLTVGQLLLANCPHPESLTFTNFSVCRIDTNAQAWTLWLPPSSLFQGPVESGAVEANTVDQAIASVRQHFNYLRQGAIHATTNPTDLAISAPTHFFIVRDPAADVSYATRYGAFHLDAQNWLVTSNGFRVQGYADTSLATVGDIRVDTNGAATAAPISNFSIQSSGQILVTLTSGETFVRGQILLQRIPYVQELIPASGLLYSNVAAAAVFPMESSFTGGPPVIAEALETPDFGPSPLSVPPQTGLRVLVTELAFGAVLQSSSDLVNWTDVQPLDWNVAQEAEYFETNPVTTGSKFFRIKAD